MGKESVIETAVCKYAKEKGFYVRKFKAPGNRGVPDRIFLSPHGVWFTIEFKAPGKEPTTLQKREIDLIKKNKGVAFVCDNLEEGEMIIDCYK
jgi:hypothetical protein